MTKAELLELVKEQEEVIASLTKEIDTLKSRIDISEQAISDDDANNIITVLKNRINSLEEKLKEYEK